MPDVPDIAYPRALAEAEDRLLALRNGEDPLQPGGRDVVGVALSGGGIRSATFALGFFQGLSRPGGGRRHGLLRGIDYLSTVSGGGYFGSFLGRLFTRDFIASPEDAEQVLLGAKEPRILKFLRENGRYMAPNGSDDALQLGATLFRNWVAIQVVLLIFALSFFFAIQGLRAFVELKWGQALLFWPQQEAILWWSPWLWLPLALFVICAIPFGWAYWLVEPEHLESSREKSAIPPYAAVLFVLLTCGVVATRVAWEAALLWSLGALIAMLTLLVRAWVGRHELFGSPEEQQERASQALIRTAYQRKWLAVWITRWLVLTGLLAIVALVDTLGQSAYAVLTSSESSIGRWLTGIGGSLGLAGLGRWLAIFFSKGPQSGRPKISFKILSTVVAILLAGVILVLLNCVSHAVAWGGESPGGAPAILVERSPAAAARAAALAAAPARRDAAGLLVAFLGSLLLSILFGQTWPFVNRSSHLPIYSARLTRAYLGASNLQRLEQDASVSEPVAGDDVELAGYWKGTRFQAGAPIHLINVTINETIDAVSQIQQQDRKGVGLALGPCGWSAGVRHHLVMPNPEGEMPPVAVYPENEYRLFPYGSAAEPRRFLGEALSLGTWLGISGAAFSTGTGMRTSLGMSFLAGLANIRLGHWWDSGVAPRDWKVDGFVKRRKLVLRLEDFLARAFPVQVHLLDEFFARFPGAARQHWYLSDGGHFENMGGYELLRRRVRFTIVVDGEMDPGYRFEGLANLIRKARLDLGAEVGFLNEDELDDVVGGDARVHLGTLDQLRRGEWVDVHQSQQGGWRGTLKKEDRGGRSLVHAALARVTYESGRPCWLLYVKPTLTGGEPSDLLEYHAAHADFPHEPTIDQFFDEAQWESYRRLGDHIAQALFRAVSQLAPSEEGSSLVKDRKPA